MNAPDIKALTARAIIPKDGSARTVTVTQNLHAGEAAFSLPTDNNTVKAFTTGKAYFKNLMQAIRSANESIYIAGWQVNWDAQFDESGTRLFDVLLNAVKNNVALKVYVMPWDDTAPIQTFDDQTKTALELINQLAGRECLYVMLANSHPDEYSQFYSHHQKQVVIDGKIGFVGGMDLCYGRFDDANFDLQADAHHRNSLNRYNGCVLQTGKIDPKDVVNPDLIPNHTGTFSHTAKDKEIRDSTIAKIQNPKCFQVPYEDDLPVYRNEHLKVNYVTLDQATQPRMPWQDSHVRIEGPAVFDLARNFVMRWNSEDGWKKENVKKPALTLPPAPPLVCTGKGCIVQVLRSAPKAMRELEYKHMPAEDQKKIKTPLDAQHNIADAMKTLIEKSQHFIYIENQFFVSAFEQEGGLSTPTLVGPAMVTYDAESSKVKLSQAATMWDNDKPPQNAICKLLADRIDIVIKRGQKEPFHVYITLPVHPEGMLNNGSIMSQVHWTMQSLVFGSHSLLNRIRRSLYADKLRKENDPKWEEAYNVGNDDYADNIPLDACDKFVTLLNLRNWAKLGTDNAPRYVTEQIYVHNKLMIVDDRYVIVGSANINDRSLLGTRDSELSVMITDTKIEKVDLCGDGKLRHVRSFARQLRMDVWNKIFGIGDGVCTSRSATELTEAVKKPGAEKSWNKIRDVARKNTVLYEAAFDFIPRNKTPYKPLDKGEELGPASIWPTWDRNPKVNIKKAPMPFDNEFWSTSQFNLNKAENLKEVKGFITLLPIDWTKGENNNIGYDTAVLVNNDIKPTLISQKPRAIG